MPDEQTRTDFELACAAMEAVSNTHRPTQKEPAGPLVCSADSAAWPCPDVTQASRAYQDAAPRPVSLAMNRQRGPWISG